MAMKKLFAAILAIHAAFAAMPAKTAYAAGSAVEIGTISASAGAEVAVPVTVKENAGIIAMGLLIRYDASALTLVSVDDCKLFADAEYSGSGALDTVPFHMTWVDALTRSAYTNTGELAVLHFKVADTAKDGFYEIGLTVEAENTFDINMTNIPFTGKSGGIRIGSGESPAQTDSAEKPAETVIAGETRPAPDSGTENPVTSPDGTPQTAPDGTAGSPAASDAVQTDSTQAAANAVTDAAASSGQSTEPPRQSSGMHPLWLIIPGALLAAGVCFFLFRGQKKHDGEDGNA